MSLASARSAAEIISHLCRHPVKQKRWFWRLGELGSRGECSQYSINEKRTKPLSPNRIRKAVALQYEASERALTFNSCFYSLVTSSFWLWRVKLSYSEEEVMVGLKMEE